MACGAPLIVSCAAPLLPIVKVFVTDAPTAEVPTTNGDELNVCVDWVPLPLSVRVGVGSPARSLFKEIVSVSVFAPRLAGSNVTGSVIDSVGATGNVPMTAPSDQWVPVDRIVDRLDMKKRSSPVLVMVTLIV